MDQKELWSIVQKQLDRKGRPIVRTLLKANGWKEQKYSETRAVWSHKDVPRKCSLVEAFNIQRELSDELKHEKESGYEM